MDNNGLLRRTLQAWFRHNAAAGDVKGAVYSSQYAGVPVEPYLGADRLGSGSFDDRLLLYIALQLDEQR